MGDHFWPVMDEFGLDHEEIGEVLGDHWAMTLWGCAFEDFLTQVFEPDGRTFVDIFLKSRGFKETARSKTYLKAISTSVISLYEVCEIVPGKSFLARDLLRGGDPVTVSEGTATQTLRQWEKIAARIVEVGGTNIITGGILPYSPEASEALLEGLREMSGKKRSRKKLILDNDTLRPAAPLFTHAWLFDTLPRVLGEVQPFICNSDGDNIVFHEVRFPLEVGITEKDIADRFAGLDDLRQENPQFWNWLGRPPAMGPAQARTPECACRRCHIGRRHACPRQPRNQGTFSRPHGQFCRASPKGRRARAKHPRKNGPHASLRYPDHRTVEGRASGQKAIGRRYPARSRNPTRPRHARQAISRHIGPARRHARRYLPTRRSPHQRRSFESCRLAQISRTAVLGRTKPARPHGNL
ncbi:hypothetical protein [Sinorhizobium meliloti]